MSRYNKLRDRLFAERTPRDFSWDDLVTLMERLGYEMDNRSGGSHCNFTHIKRRTTLTICRPHGGGEKTLKPYQVKDVRNRLIEDESYDD